jgi:apolipoprotein N-acyltransferase
LKNVWDSPIVRSRYPAAIAAGLLLAAAFPKIGVAGLAWLAPGLIYASSLGKSGAEKLRIAYMAGLAYYLASLYWLLLIPYRWHGIPLGPAAGWLALGAYLALYPATWVWLISGKLFSDGPFSSHWAHRTLWALSGAAVWVALEMIVSRLFTGFPWNLLGSSQYQMTPLIQIASVTGIYGVSFLIVWFSLSLVSAAVSVVRRPTARSVWMGEMLLPLLAVALCFNLGFRHLRQEARQKESAAMSSPARTLKIALVQPSIPQTLIWDESNDEERFHDLVRLSEQALAAPADLLIWPEAAVPKLFRYDQETFVFGTNQLTPHLQHHFHYTQDMFSAITNLAVSHHVWMIVGADAAAAPPGATNLAHAAFYNSSFLVSPTGEITGCYHKRTLVVFGEYIPLVRWLPFVKWFTPIEGGYASGEHAVPFVLPNLHVKTSTLICFEDIFPQLAPEYVDEDTDFLVNLTNNGWFGEGAAQWQHAAGALFRAVENGLPLVRCSNNGLTCWMDGCGRLREIFRDPEGSIYGAGSLTIELPLPAPGQKHPPTFYHRHGDWFGWLCVGFAGMKVTRRLWRLRRKSFGSQNPPPHVGGYGYQKYLL